MLQIMNNRELDVAASHLPIPSDIITAFKMQSIGTICRGGKNVSCQNSLHVSYHNIIHKIGISLNKIHTECLFNILNLQ